MNDKVAEAEYRHESSQGAVNVVFYVGGEMLYEWKFAHDVVDLWQNSTKLSGTPRTFAREFSVALRNARVDGFHREVGFWAWFKRWLGGSDTWII